jgi:drug/metabolite transporter (DMT)-like permease
MDTVAVWLLGAIWGGVFLAMKLAVATLPPFTAALCRIGLAALFLLPLVLPRQAGRAQLWTHAPQLLIMGLLNNTIPQALMAWSLGRIDSGLAAILNATMPPFTILLAWGLPPRTRPTVLQLGGIALGLGGVAVLVGPDALRGLGSVVWGQLAMVGVAFSYAAAAVYGRRLAGLSPLTASTGQLTGAALWLVPLALMTDHPWALHPSALSLAAVSAAALLGTALAYLLYFFILSRGGPTRLSLVTYVSPVFAVGWGWLVLDERLTWNAAGGLVLIAVAVLCVTGQAREAMAWLVRRINPTAKSSVEVG